MECLVYNNQNKQYKIKDNIMIFCIILKKQKFNLFNFVKKFIQTKIKIIFMKINLEYF